MPARIPGRMLHGEFHKSDQLLEMILVFLFFFCAQWNNHRIKSTCLEEARSLVTMTLHSNH